MNETFVLNPINQKRFSDVYPYDTDQSVASRLVEIELVPEGKWVDANGNDLVFTIEDLQEMERNFSLRSHNGAGLPVTIGHPMIREDGLREELDSVGWIRKVFVGMGESGKMVLKGLTEWTEGGLQKLQEGAFKFLSPEIEVGHVDQQTGENVGLVLLTAALTNFPFFKELATVQFSENENIKLLVVKGGDLKMNDSQNDNTEEVVEETEAVEETTDLEPEDTEAEEEVEEDEEEEAEESEEEGEVTLKASEVAKLRADADKGKEAYKKLRFAEIQADVNSLVYSESNKEGKLKESQRDEALKFATSLSDRERKQFVKLLGGLPSLGSLFSEMGKEGNTEEVTDDLDTKIKNIMSAKGITYSEAYKQVADEEVASKRSV